MAASVQDEQEDLRHLRRIGETYDIDPTLIRLIVVFLCFATAIIPIALTYVVAWLIMPPPESQG